MENPSENNKHQHSNPYNTRILLEIFCRPVYANLQFFAVVLAAPSLPSYYRTQPPQSRKAPLKLKRTFSFSSPLLFYPLLNRTVLVERNNSLFNQKIAHFGGFVKPLQFSLFLAKKSAIAIKNNMCYSIYIKGPKGLFKNLKKSTANSPQAKDIII